MHTNPEDLNPQQFGNSKEIYIISALKRKQEEQMKMPLLKNVRSAAAVINKLLKSS
jgi:hypothetical protein